MTICECGCGNLAMLKLFIKEIYGKPNINIKRSEYEKFTCYSYG